MSDLDFPPQSTKPPRVIPRFLIAPDKFKGSLSAGEAADAIAAGVRRSLPGARIDLCPIADGGEGFMETLAPVLKARWISCPAMDALGRSIESRYLLEGTTAILEMAETAGLWRLAPEERNPVEATTFGTGLQMVHAIREHGVSKIILGIGGSATNDGGAGMAAALGIRFLDSSGNSVPGRLIDVVRIDETGRISLPEIVAACDVDNPLLGPRGATAVFSAQKGVAPEERVLLEEAMTRLVVLSEGHAIAALPGAGAAGGLGFGLMRFAGARLLSGFEILAGLLDLPARVAAATHVITGEGSLDRQSLSGKGPVSLARMAKASRIPVTAFCGQTDDESRNSGLFQTIHALADTGLPLETLISNAARLLTEATADHFRNPEI